MNIGTMKTREVLKTLSKFGYYIARQNGSHRTIKNANGNCFTVSLADNESVGRPMLSKILRQSMIDPNTFAANV